MASRMNPSLTLLLAATAAVGLAGCGKSPEDQQYTTDTVDKSGGKLIVEDAPSPDQQPNPTLPDTPMKPVPDDQQQPAAGQ